MQAGVKEDECKISFGVAGWSYPDWSGYVYSRRVKDKLAFLAEFVDMIEINSTFYRIPDATISSDWLSRISHIQDFFFSAKLHQSFTHEHQFDSTHINTYCEGIKPLADAGKLQRLLAQFRYDFDYTHEHTDVLKRIRDAFAGIAPVVCEFRHVSWQQEEARSYVDQLSLSTACLDYPTASDSYTDDHIAGTGFAYFRLHGRNKAAWFDKKAGRDQTYNYMYSTDELQRIKQRVADVLPKSRSITVVGNNHWHGKEVANVLQLKSMMTGKKLKIPPALLKHYPQLSEIADYTESMTNTGDRGDSLF